MGDISLFRHAMWIARESPATHVKRIEKQMSLNNPALVFLTALLGVYGMALGDRSVDVPQLTIESYRLPNGLKVALNPDPTAPRTTVCVTYHVGSKNERPGLTGFAHFFEHMMFRGTKNVPNYDVPLQQAGGSPNAFTTEDITVYFETVPAHYLERAIFMEAERMAFLPSALDVKKFDVEREIVKNERRQRMENVPYGLARETISSYIFPKGHPYSWSVIGSMKDLNNSDLSDLRKFFYEFYHPGNATLCIVGAFDPTVAKTWIDEYFGVLARGPRVANVEIRDTPTVSKRITQRDQVQFPRVYWTWPTVPESHRDAAALELLGNLLSDGDASRLHRALMIDETLVTKVSARSDAREIAGIFSIDAIVSPGTKPAEVERVLQEQIARIRTTPPTHQEVRRAIRKDQKSSLVRLTATTGRAFAISWGFAQYDDPHYYQTVYRAYANVTPADVQRVVSRYLTPEKLVLHVLPTSGGEEESPAILAGPLATSAVPPAISARDPLPGTQWGDLPDAGEYREFAPPEFEVRQLSNGLSVWIAPWRTLPLVAARLIVPVGSAENASGKYGLSKLTATMWEKGTQDLTSTEFAGKLDGLGTSLGIGATFSTTELGFTVVKDALPETLALVGSMVAEPRMDPADFERERSLQLSALARGPDNPSWIARRVFPGLLYGRDHPYGLPISGFDHTVRSLSLSDVQGFYQDHFVPTNSTLIIVGDVDTESLIRQIEAAWKNWQGAAVKSSPPASAATAKSATVYLIDKPGAVQSVVSVGRLWRARNDPSHLATRIGNRVLGGDYTSRINKNLREKNGYTYGAYSEFDHIRETGDWSVSSNVRVDVTAAALSEIMTELESLREDRPLTAEEIRIARTALLNTFPAQFESPQQIAASLSTLARHQLPKNYLRDFAQHLREVDDQDVRRFMSELCSSTELRTLIVGDREQIVPQLENAGFDRLQFLDVNGQPSD